MSLILNIDTAIDSASICLAQNGVCFALSKNEVKNESAAWLHTAIQNLLGSQNLELSQLNAIAVTSGPGSYTGLRVGMATAKGLCYVLNIPLINISTLQMMLGAVNEKETDLYCPMIDARRMEVFTAVYLKTGEELIAPHNLILDDKSFSNLLIKQSITFFGNGSPKLSEIINSKNAIFKQVESTAAHMAPLSFKHYANHSFANLAYCEPNYGKEFYAPSPKNP